MNDKPKLLFICSRNRWRSPTAENIYKNSNRFHVRSAGLSASARIRLSEKLLQWADVIFVMEKEHRQRLRRDFSEAIAEKELVVLHIPDEYPYMDSELVDMISTTVEAYFAR